MSNYRLRLIIFFYYFSWKAVLCFRSVYVRNSTLYKIAVYLSNHLRICEVNDIVQHPIQYSIDHICGWNVLLEEGRDLLVWTLRKIYFPSPSSRHFAGVNVKSAERLHSRAPKSTRNFNAIFSKNVPFLSCLFQIYENKTMLKSCLNKKVAESNICRVLSLPAVLGSR